MVGEARIPESEANRGAKLRARLACESSAGELLVEYPDADSIAALDFSTYSQFSAASHGLPRSGR